VHRTNLGGCDAATAVAAESTTMASADAAGLQAVRTADDAAVAWLQRDHRARSGSAVSLPGISCQRHLDTARQLTIVSTRLLRCLEAGQ
jgi:hypothetical protein